MAAMISAMTIKQNCLKISTDPLGSKCISSESSVVNLNSIINMIIRNFLRRGINAGINRGMGAFSRRNATRNDQARDDDDGSVS